jgi:dihydroorotate dehydrogenase
LFDDEFQLEMLKSVATAGDDRPDFVVYANRLFDPHREFDGQRGIAMGGPDLSSRNLRVLGEFQDWSRAQRSIAPLEISATGDICSGRRAVEYLLCGCRTFQLHTFFQLPSSEYAMRQGSKLARALHQLYFHPRDGFIAWILHAANRLRCNMSPARLLDLASAAGERPA